MGFLSQPAAIRRTKAECWNKPQCELFSVVNLRPSDQLITKTTHSIITVKPAEMQCWCREEMESTEQIFMQFNWASLFKWQYPNWWFAFTTSQRASLIVQLVKNLPAMQETLDSIAGLGRSPGEGKGYPLQYSSLENSMNCIVHGVTKNWTWLSDFHSLTHSLVIKGTKTWARAF